MSIVVVEHTKETPFKVYVLCCISFTDEMGRNGVAIMLSANRIVFLTMVLVKRKKALAAEYVHNMQG